MQPQRIILNDTLRRSRPVAVKLLQAGLKFEDDIKNYYLGEIN